MTQHQFIVPTADQFMDLLGVTPEIRGEYGIQGIAISATDGFELDLTMDPLARAVTLSVRRNASEVMLIVREGATQLRLWGAAPEIVVEFETEDTTGRIEVRLVPSLHVSETLLLG